MTPPTLDDGSPRSYPDENDDVQDIAFAKRSCCFCLPFAGRGGAGPVFWERINGHPDTSRAGEDPWWNRGWKKVREWSELVAGPKWKTLIRRISRKKATGGGGKFQYDALSYALNFDEGQTGHLADEYYRRGFSSRFSLPPSSAKSSLDFDREGLSFT